MTNSNAVRVEDPNVTTFIANVHQGKYVYFTLNGEQEVRIDLRRLKQMAWRARSNANGVANAGPLSVRPTLAPGRRRG